MCARFSRPRRASARLLKTEQRVGKTGCDYGQPRAAATAVRLTCAPATRPRPECYVGARVRIMIGYAAGEGWLLPAVAFSVVLVAKAMNKRRRWLLVVLVVLACYVIAGIFEGPAIQYRVKRGSNTYHVGISTRTIFLALLREYSPPRPKGMGFPESTRSLGVGTWHQYSNRAWDQRSLTLNWWILLPITGCLVVGYRRRQGRRRLMRMGCCAPCGYDLRATPDRCPECGTVADPVAGAAA